MTDQTLETGSTSGEMGKPTPNFSEGENAQPSKGTAPNFETLSEDAMGTFVSKLLESPRFQETLERTVQSQKDKRFGKLGGEVEKLQKTVAGLDIEALTSYQKLIDAGKTPEDALNTMKLESLFNMVTSGQVQGQTNNQPASTPKPVGAGQNEGWTAAQKALLTAFGVNENDPGFIEFVGSKQFANSNQYIQELTMYLAQRGQQPNGIPLQTGAGLDTSNTASREQQLYAAYKKEKELIPRGPHTVRARQDLVIKYRKQGFDPEGYEIKNNISNY